MDPKDFLSEAHIMKRLRHPKLIQVCVIFDNPNFNQHSFLSCMPSAPWRSQSTSSRNWWSLAAFSNICRFEPSLKIVLRQKQTLLTFFFFFSGQGEAAETSPVDWHVSTGGFLSSPHHHHHHQHVSTSGFPSSSSSYHHYPNHHHQYPHHVNNHQQQ